MPIASPNRPGLVQPGVRPTPALPGAAKTDQNGVGQLNVGRQERGLMNIARILGTAIFSLAAVACSTTQTYWRHNTLSGSAAEQQFVADRGTCTGAAYRAIGGPPQSPQLPPPSTTNYSGYTSQGTYIQGQAQTTYSDPNPFLSGVRQGEADAQYRAALTNVFNGCMAQRGWSQYSVTR